MWRNYHVSIFLVDDFGEIDNACGLDVRAKSAWHAAQMGFSRDIRKWVTQWGNTIVALRVTDASNKETFFQVA